jgi:signal transduction histidine kinase
LFQWIQSKKWLPDVIIGALAAIVLGLVDYINQGTNGLIVSLLFASAFLFFRQFSYLAVALVAGGAAAQILLGIHPTVAGFSVSILVFLASALGVRLWSLAILSASVLAGIVLAWQAAFNSSLVTQFYGITVYNNDGRWWGFAFAAISICGLNGFAWLLGAFLIEFYKERIASKERDLVQSHNLRTALEMAEQNERFQIASDINEAVLERVSAMLTLTDGARYASRLDQQIAGRTLDRLVDLIRDTHQELRRLYDMLNRSVQVAAAPPDLNDLLILAVQLRQSGYQTKIAHQGKRIKLIPSAELNIYRIVFDAVENVKKHASLGTAIDIDFIWSEHGLQVLVKDNGAEVTKQTEVNLDLTGQEEAEADLEALTQEVSGAGITGMRERAELFGGNIEAHFVPGVGFTLNAIFPGIEEFRQEEGR